MSKIKIDYPKGTSEKDMDKIVKDMDELVEEIKKLAKQHGYEIADINKFKCLIDFNGYGKKVIHIALKEI